MSHQGSLSILEWVAYPFSSVSSRPGIKPGSPALQVDSLWLSHQGTPSMWYFCSKCTTLIIRKYQRNPRPGGSDRKDSAYGAGDPGLIPGREDSPEKGMATHSSILAWRIPSTEEPGGLQCGLAKELDTTERLSTHPHSLVTSTVAALMSSFVHWTMVIYTVNTGGSLGEGYIWTLFYFCNFSVSPKLFQTKKLKNK